MSHETCDAEDVAADRERQTFIVPARLKAVTRETKFNAPLGELETRSVEEERSFHDRVGFLRPLRIRPLHRPSIFIASETPRT